MKSFSAIAAVVLATAIPAFAQSVLDLPKCAQNDVLLAIGTSGCIPTDFECICKNKSFIDSLVKTIPAKCTPEETYEVSNFATVFCDSTGVDIDLPASIQSPVAAPSTSAPAPSTSSAAPSTTPSLTPTTSVISLTSTLSISETVVVSGTPSASANGTLSGTPSLTRASLTSATTASVSTSSSPAAGAIQTAGLVGLMGAVFVGVMGM